VRAPENALVEGVPLDVLAGVVCEEVTMFEVTPGVELDGVVTGVVALPLLVLPL
jgi:hypothetical protein